MAAPRSGPEQPTRPLLPSPWRRKNLRFRTLFPISGALLLLLYAAPSPASLALGAALLLAGAGLRLWAAGVLVKTDVLTVSGPYAHVRHPLYLGTLLVGSGLVFAAGFGPARYGLPAGFALFFLYYLPYKERAETRRLLERHGAPYAAYHAAVPALIPRPRPWRSELPATPWSFDRVVANNELGAALAALAFYVLLAAS